MCQQRAINTRLWSHFGEIFRLKKDIAVVLSKKEKKTTASDRPSGFPQPFEALGFSDERSV